MVAASAARPYPERKLFPRTGNVEGPAEASRDLRQRRGTGGSVEGRRQRRKHAFDTSLLEHRMV
jgi:hypothetical protein